ncbi:sulfotransferase domain-containing protein [Geminocystis sp.]|uniref:sulfotransferase domain-containing protein n=1 Tax=Geminocystis sp. TaxID=2664100 RepID=UPI0035942039
MFNKFMKELQYRENILPDFLIIGGMKCGTTSLHYYLKFHPEIVMSTEKELDFFIKEKNLEKGVDWYKSQFKGKAKIYGEASPNYTNYPRWEGCPERIYNLKSDIKLIYILRDPLVRILSQYIHEYKEERENLPFDEAIFNNDDYIFRSSYYLQLEQYLKYFPPYNIFITTIEELSNFPESTLKSILNFLNISEDISMIPYQKILHNSIHKRRKNKLGNIISKNPLIKKIDLLPPPYRYRLQHLIYFPFSHAIKRPQLTENLREKLINLLQEDVYKLREYTGKNFEQWCL